MKRNYFYLLLALCIGAVVMSCRPTNEPEKPDDPKHPHIGDTEINTDSPVGTIGILDGREAIVVDLGGSFGKLAIATKNEGATSVTEGAGSKTQAACYGERYTFDDAKIVATYNWYVPSKEEMDALAPNLTNWMVKSQNVGRMWQVGDNSLYLPYAGLGVDSTLNELGNLGHYWTSTPDGDTKVFSFDIRYNYSSTISTQHRYHFRSVRLFHKLPEPKPLLTPDSPVGTIGMLDGREGIVVDLGDTLGRVVIATMNIGATDPLVGYYSWDSAACFGDYYSYEEAMSKAPSIEWGAGWYVPSLNELKAVFPHLTYDELGDGENAHIWEWKVTKDARLYFPYAGHMEKEDTIYIGRGGLYCTSDTVDDFYYAMDLSPAVQEFSKIGRTYGYKVSVRLFHRFLEPVDLGLTSGTKWASVNIGANVPWETGKYFAWGETKEKPRNYYWDNYFDTDDGGNTFKKYNITGGKTTLDLEDDAAHVYWGGDWRMPTSAEWDELIAECSWQYTIINGVAGIYVMGNTGNGIFLRGTGWYSEDDYWVNGDWVAHYWSSTINEGNSAGAHYLEIDPGSYQNIYASRRWGQPVRAVQSAK